MINSWREDIRTTGKLRIAEKAGLQAGALEGAFGPCGQGVQRAFEEA